MNYRSVTAALVLVGVAGLALALSPLRSAVRTPSAAPADEGQRKADSGQRKPESARRMLPGVEDGGAIRLPNQWSLQPAGKQIPLGDFPVNLALHPTGRWIAALHAGFGTHEIAIVTVQGDRQKITCRVALDETFY